MSKDTPNKQKKIDDVLLSIDSLLDTATDIELSDVDRLDNNAANSTTRSPIKPKQKDSPAKTKAPVKPKSNLKNTASPCEKKLTQTRTAPAGKKEPLNSSKSDIDRGITTKFSDISQKETTESRTQSNQSPEKIHRPISKDIKKALKSDPAKKTKIQANKDPDLNNNLNEDKENSLNFTTVDDDLSQAMRELPVLEDIVTAEDLALIGSGKEPPKKILTEAYKRLSLTDKLIEILANQLSDYNISKLEFEYLHELFDEEIDKENSKKL